MFKRRRYVYFVAYAGSGAIGRCEVYFPRPITAVADIEQVEVQLRFQHKVQFITITGFQFLRREK